MKYSIGGSVGCHEACKRSFRSLCDLIRSLIDPPRALICVFVVAAVRCILLEQQVQYRLFQMPLALPFGFFRYLQRSDGFAIGLEVAFVANLCLRHIQNCKLFRLDRPHHLLKVLRCLGYVLGVVIKGHERVILVCLASPINMQL